MSAANNLAALEGGRHAEQQYPAAMPLDDQRVVIADLVKRWIEWHSDAP